MVILTSACCGSDKPRACTSYTLSSISLHWIFFKHMPWREHMCQSTIILSLC